tara:strand:- start:43 stop:3402 length:3360 start_codon:yes stop_codon:yes gene_type:complete
MAELTSLKDLGFDFPTADKYALPMVSTVAESVFLKEQRLQEEAIENTRITDMFNTAYSENFSVSSLADGIEKARIDKGIPITTFTPELVKELTTGLSIPSSLHVIEEAKTYGYHHAMKTREFNLQTEKNLKTLEAGGWKGMLANVFSVMFDPAEWAVIAGTTAAASAAFTPAGGAGVATVGAMRQFYKGKKAFFIGAGLGASESAAFEAIRANVKYNIDLNDVLIAGGLGATIGGGLNLAANGWRKAGQRAMIQNKLIKGIELTDSEKAFDEAFGVKKLTANIIQKELTGEAFKDSTIGTSAVPQVEGDLPEIAGWSMLGLRKLISVNYRLGTHALQGARHLARALLLNPVGYKKSDLATNSESASEIAESLQGQFRVKHATLLRHQQQRWIKETGLTAEDFNIAVARYVRGIDTDVTDGVKLVGDNINKLQTRLAELAVEADVTGFTKDLLGKNPFYMSRIFNDDKIRVVRDEFEDSAIQNLVETAIRKEQPDLEVSVEKYLRGKGRKKIGQEEVDGYIKRLAAAYTRSITDPSLKITGTGGSNEMALADIETLLKAEFDDITEDAIEIISDILTQTKTRKAHKRSRKRVVLDEGTVIQVANKNGEIKSLAFTDLLEENADQLFNSYIFQMSGAIGLARNGIDTNKAGTSFKEFKDRLSLEAGDKNMGTEELKEATDALDFVYDGLTRRLGNRDETQTMQDLGVAWRAYSFAVNMGMSGMSALMELSNVMFEASFMTLLKGVPEYRKLVKTLSDPNAPQDVIDELVYAIGMGDEVSLGLWNNVTRFDTEDVGTTISSERGGMYNRKGSSLNQLRGKAGAGAENLAYEGQKFVAYWSGLTGVTQTLRRLSMLNFTNEIALAAGKGKIPFSAIKRQQLGLTDEMAIKIRDTMNSSKVIKNKNGTVKKLNIKDWDQDVREAFSSLGFKDARLNVQETNIGSVNKFMKTNQIGKTFLQFMSFTLASLEQQTMRFGVRAASGDAGAVTKILLSAGLMGSLMYMARVHLNSTGRSDKEEYIKERMTTENIALGALQQIGAFSIFSYISQLTTGAMHGNTYAITPPVFSLGQSIFSSGNAIWEGLVEDDQDMTETEWRSFLRLAPASSLYGVRQILNGMAADFSR